MTRRRWVLVLATVSLLGTTGCWSVLGRHEPFVKPVPEGGLFTTPAFWITVGLLGADLLVRIKGKVARRGGELNAAHWLIGFGVMLLMMAITAAVSWLLTLTILGTFSYWLLSWIWSWGVIGIVVTIALGIVTGLAPGFAGASSLFLYVVYHDPRVLYFSTIPALAADVVEAMVRPEKGEG